MFFFFLPLFFERAFYKSAPAPHTCQQDETKIVCEQGCGGRGDAPFCHAIGSYGTDGADKTDTPRSSGGPDRKRETAGVGGHRRGFNFKTGVGKGVQARRAGQNAGGIHRSRKKNS